jgi:hypothetical protein
MQRCTDIAMFQACGSCVARALVCHADETGPTKVQPARSHGSQSDALRAMSRSACGVHSVTLSAARVAIQIGTERLG